MATDPHPKPTIETPSPDTKEILRCLETLHPAGTTFEIRIPHPRRGPHGLHARAVYAGYFDDPATATLAISRLTGADAEAVYTSLNGVDPALRARCSNRLAEAGKNALTTDSQIPRIQHFLIDIDPTRPAGISATEAEQRAALTRTAEIRAYLTEQQGWPAPRVDGCSGNGGALIYGLNLPNDAATHALLTSAMQALAQLFGSDVVTIDETVTNPARIGKVFGTVAAKGDHIPERPWRRATATYTPDASIVTVAQLAALAALAPAPNKPAAPATSPGTRRWTVAEKLDAVGIGYTVDTTSYATVYALDRCLTSTEHTDGAKLLEMNSGALGYKCHHNSCYEKRWEDARSALELERDASPRAALTPAPTPTVTPPPPTPIRPEAPPAPPPPVDFAQRGVMTAGELRAKHFAEPVEIVDGTVPEGLTLVVGRGKMGKSRLMFGGVAVPVALGGRALGVVPVKQGRVLYLALEDGPRRIQARLEEILGDTEAPARLHIATEWPRLDEGGMPALAAWLEQYPDTRLIVIDTLKKVRSRQENAHRRLYDLDYDSLEGLQQLATRHHIAIVVIHHANKVKITDDPLDVISGSTGIEAVVDTAILLRRTRGESDAALLIFSRDLGVDREVALQWDSWLHGWRQTGEVVDPAAPELTDARKLILEAIQQWGCLSPLEAAGVLQKPYENVRQTCWRMERDGQLERCSGCGGGKYRIPGNTSHSDNSSHTGNSSHSGSATPMDEATVTGTVEAGHSENPRPAAEKAPTVIGVIGVTGDVEVAALPARAGTPPHPLPRGYSHWCRTCPADRWTPLPVGDERCSSCQRTWRGPDEEAP